MQKSNQKEIANHPIPNEKVNEDYQNFENGPTWRRAVL